MEHPVDSWAFDSFLQVKTMLNKNRHHHSQVRFSDGSAELPADCGLREGLGALQHRGALHPDRHAAGKSQLLWQWHRTQLYVEV